ncbi:MAG: glycosyltransferase [Prevotellaceae bacterium]|jgi:hypothetical protein|nr:glycosyltransferase [Prevotellaceae bacterium]
MSTSKNLAPIVLFVYNRPHHTQRTVEALKNNALAKESELFIFSDAAKNEAAVAAVHEVREYISRISGFRKVHIIERPENMGCDPSIVDGVSRVISEYKKVIEVEDDIVTTPLFLEYLNKALNIFEHDERIWSISGYTPPITIPASYVDDICLSIRPVSWGFGTWKNRWDVVDWTKTGIEEVFHNAQARKSFLEAGEDILSTLIKHPEVYDIAIYYHMRRQHKYSVQPVVSLLQNIGTDGSGVHFTSKQKKYEATRLAGREPTINPNIQPNKEIIKAIRKFYTKPLWRKVVIAIVKRLGVYDFLVKRFG